jgi:hypothetical protein
VPPLARPVPFLAYSSLCACLAKVYAPSHSKCWPSCHCDTRALCHCALGLHAVVVAGLCAIMIFGHRAFISCRFWKPLRAGEAMPKF